ncbi:MAG: FtsX-like permease family protein [Phycisphaerales bacterium]
MTDLSIILRSLRSRLFVTLTTIATVAIAVALMLTLLTMKDAGRDAFRRGSGTTHLLVSADSSPLVAVLNGVFYANPPRNSIPWSEYRRIAESYPWEWAIPTQLGDSYRGFPALATTRDFLEKFKPDPKTPWAFTEGRAFEKPFEAVLGSEAARETRLRVGSTFFLTHGSGGSREAADEGADDAAGDADPAGGGAHAGHHGAHEHGEFPYTVVGILAPTGTPHDRAVMTDLESTWIIHAHERREREDPKASRTTAADLVDGDRRITGILLRLPTRPGMGVSAAMQQQFDALRRDTTIVVAQPEQQIDRLFAIVGSVDRLFVAMAAIVMLAGAVAIMLALASSMEMRRRQIAVLRVLGCSRSRIFALVLTESALLGLGGAAVGVVLAIVGCAVAATVLRQTLGLVIAPDPRLDWIAMVGAATVLLAAVAGIAPAFMAYRTSVSRSLRPIG